jgi:phosphonoacetaldehyde hydrolase
MLKKSERFLGPFFKQPIYKGPLKTIILDWSGTCADRYVMAPAVVFVDVFEKHRVPITMEQARRPMGLRKDLHIAEILKNPEVAAQWEKVYNREPNQNDVDNMFKDFVPMQLACLPKYSKLLPNVTEITSQLKTDFGLKIGMTTGFTREMVDILLEETKKQGFEPDVAVAGDDVETGWRPQAHMINKNLDLLGTETPISSVLKVDDTTSGVGEGLSAGCFTVGVSRYSNYMDINSLEEEATLSEEELEARNLKSREILINAGAHYVINDMRELPPVIRDINKKLARGEGP